MTEERITFDTAQLAKEKGFIISCTTEYEEDLKTIKNFQFHELPTQTELEKWLRDTHKILIIPYLSYEYEKWSFNMKLFVFNSIKTSAVHTVNGVSTNFETIKEIALQKALKLIKLEKKEIL